MAINKVDYDVLTSGVGVYRTQAEAIDAVLNALTTMNGELQEGWTNQTATAFIERFDAEYGPALGTVRDAIESIANFIQEYMDNRQADDAQGAAAVKA